MCKKRHSKIQPNRIRTLWIQWASSGEDWYWFAVWLMCSGGWEQRQVLHSPAKPQSTGGLPVCPQPPVLHDGAAHRPSAHDAIAVRGSCRALAAPGRLREWWQRRWKEHLGRLAVFTNSVSDAPAGPRHSRAVGVSHGGVWVMHETALVRLPHLHQTQEDNGEGNFAATPCVNCTFSLLALSSNTASVCFYFLLIVSHLLVQTCVLLLQFVEAIVVLVRQTSHLRVTRALRPIFLVDCRYCGAVRRYIGEDLSVNLLINDWKWAERHNN